MVEVARGDLAAAHQALITWLLEHAFDLWWTHGADRVRGGFHERLRQDATPTGEPRRARLHPRQMFAYALAPELGWRGPAAEAVGHALDFFLTHYRRPDGLYRVCVEANGTPRDDRAVLYDQAFALLGFASAFETLGDEQPRTLARDLHEVLRSRLAHPDTGFEESVPRSLPLTANSHMHLFEASLAWSELDPDRRWVTLASEITELALTRFIDVRTGVLHEFFDADWKPAAGAAALRIEPGHQFEWGGLLLRFASRNRDPKLVPAALRLIEIGETRGVDRVRNVAVDVLADERAMPDGPARLWPQTERIKAACIAAEEGGDASRYRPIALEATRSLITYFDTPVRGLWRDRMTPAGSFLDEPAPASSFYHIVGAAAQLSRLVRQPVA